MSTEHQKYSIENQSATISAYALLHKLTVVRTYSDRGRSGLSLEGRAALKQLIAEVEAGAADFEAILVYDISRWGRFQDSDESAHYEYLCRRAGISVHYCAEQFQNDGSPLSAIIKGLKRAMAGEYSRELSHKVFAGQSRLLDSGFNTGGRVPYGLQRELRDQTGAFKAILRDGERKSVQSDRVVLAPGSRDQIEVVRWVFQQFAKEGCCEHDIALALNSRGLKMKSGTAWNAVAIQKMLRNEKYIGTYIWNRCSSKLKSPRKQNSPDKWRRNRNAFAPIVASALFDSAQARFRDRDRRRSTEYMIDALRGIYREHGHVTVDLLPKAPDGPTREAIVRRFGTFSDALIRAGVSSGRKNEYIEINRRLRQERGRIVTEIQAGMEKLGACVERRRNVLAVDQSFSVSVVVLCAFRPRGYKPYWRLPLGIARRADYMLVVQMNCANSAVGAYYLLPQSPPFDWPAHLSHVTYTAFRPFRVEAPEAAIELARRVPLGFC